EVVRRPVVESEIGEVDQPIEAHDAQGSRRANRHGEAEQDCVLTQLQPVEPTDEVAPGAPRPPAEHPVGIPEPLRLLIGAAWIRHQPTAEVSRSPQPRRSSSAPGSSFRILSTHFRSFTSMRSASHYGRIQDGTWSRGWKDVEASDPAPSARRRVDHFDTYVFTTARPVSWLDGSDGFLETITSSLDRRLENGIRTLRIISREEHLSRSRCVDLGNERREFLTR